MIQTPRGLILIGDPVAHSLSPKMHTAALLKADLHLSYTAKQVKESDLPTVITEIRERGLAGNVTIPHKKAMFELCDAVSALARKVKAVNTFWMQGDILCGDNTDVGGIDFATKHLMGKNLSGLKVALIGAGGAAGAVAAAAQGWSDCELIVWNRSPDRLKQFVEDFDNVSGVSIIEDALQDANLVINATSIGLNDDSFPCSLDLLGSNTAVLDLVYKKDETAWVRAVRDTGHRAEDGIYMLIEQGALAFKRWFGFEPDRSVMWDTIKGGPQDS